MRIDPENWGKDHFSTLLYLETRVVDHGGVIRGEQMRSRDSGYPCRLRKGTKQAHGDLDCIEDMRAVGLLTGGDRNTFAAYQAGEGPNPIHEPYAPFALTDAGWSLAHLLRRWRGSGKTKSLPPPEQVLVAIGEKSLEEKGPGCPGL